jgi:hypothetical protein
MIDRIIVVLLMIYSSSQNSSKANAPIPNFQRLSAFFKFVWGRPEVKRLKRQNCGPPARRFCSGSAGPQVFDIEIATHGFDYGMNLRRKTCVRYRKRQAL